MGVLGNGQEGVKRGSLRRHVTVSHFQVSTLPRLHIWTNAPIRLKKKKNSVSQSCRPYLFFCAHMILQNSDFHFFFLEIIFFFHFYYEKQRKFAVLEEFKHVGAQKTCKIPFDFWKYGSWNFSVIFGFGCAWRQRPIEVKKIK